MTNISFKKIISENIYFMGGFLCYLLIGSLVLLLTPHESVVLWLNRYHHSSTDWIFKYLTHIGDGIFYIVVLLVFLFIRYYYALMMLVSFLLTSLIVQPIKFLVNAPRPIAYLDKSVPLHLVEGVQVHSHHSFPSGHSAIAFMLFCILALYTRNKKLGLVFLCLAILVSLTRSYLVQHFFIDTYFGALIGVSVTTGVYAFFENSEKLRHHKYLNRSLISKVERESLKSF